MAKATHPTTEKIAVVFDLDGTLVPDTYDNFVDYLGLNASEFRQQVYKPLRHDGWDSIPARFYSLIEYSENVSSRDDKITRSTLSEFGKSLQPFDGVPDMFTRLQDAAKAIAPNVEVEYYLVTSGFVEVARSMSIAPFFKAMWGPEFHYAESGEIKFLKKSLSHPEKPRYLYYLSKGIRESDGSENLLFVYEEVPQEELAIPLSQVIYVGDGTSDIPCFAMLNHEGGTAIGVYPDGSSQEWADHYQLSEGQRVSNLAPAEYTENSELMKSLVLAVEGICKKIQLQQLSIRE